MATVRQNIMPLPKPQNELIPELIPCTLPEAPENIWLTGFEKNAGSEKSIAESPIIVAVGGGIKSKNDIPLFEDVARCLGGELASSRVLVERGWMPQSKQIGLSGSSISASLLFTFGISGSVQFISGIKNAKQIVSVNTDPQAPIFAVSSRGFICDIYEAAEKILTLSQIYS